MTIRKWNFEKREYEDYVVPEGKVPMFYSTDMNELGNCASCGRDIKYGDCYTSRQLHTLSGMGYSVCPDCHAKEVRKEREAREKREKEARYWQYIPKRKDEE